MSYKSPNVHLSGFAKSPNLRKKQSIELSDLVSQEAPWLTNDFPRTVARYSDRSSALKSIRRVSPGIDRYIVRRAIGELAYGIATVMRDQTINHPDQGEITATDIDYWLGRDGRFDKVLHSSAVRDLLCMAVDLKPEARSSLIMATAREDQPQFEAFANFMAKAGSPSRITVPGESDPHTMAKNGAVLQVFTVDRSDVDI